MGEREGNSRHITSPACGSQSQIVNNPGAQSVSLAEKGEGERGSQQPAFSPHHESSRGALGQGVRGRECIFHFLAFVWSARGIGFCLYFHVFA